MMNMNDADFGSRTQYFKCASFVMFVFHEKFFFEPKTDSVVESRTTDHLKGSMAMFVIKSF